MTSTAPTARWLPAAIARAAVVHSPPSHSGPRHLAPDADESILRLVTADVVTSSGRHAEPEWGRALFDPRRDEDLFDWLGFTAER